MKTVALLSTRTGSGATMLAINLAVLSFRDGHATHLIEFDEGPVSQWYESRAIHHPNNPPEMTVADYQQLPDVIRNLEGNACERVFLDVSAAQPAIAAAAVEAADFSLVVCRPTTPDMSAARDLIRVLRLRQEPAAIVINQSVERVSRMDKVERAFANVGVPMANALVNLRSEHQQALGRGLGTVEFIPAGKGAQEIRQFYNWLRGTLVKAPTPAP